MRSLIHEHWLEAEGVAYQYFDRVPLGQFDLAASKLNQARLECPITDEVVDEYAIAMRAGAVFPAVIAHEGKNGFVIIDGNHRICAAGLAGQSTFDLYLVLIQDVRVWDRLTRSANTLEGRRLPREALIQQALYFHAVYGEAFPALAKRFQVPENALKQADRVQRTQRRLAAYGVSPTCLVPTNLDALSALENDPALVAATQLARDAQLTKQMLRSLVRAVQDKHTEADQLAVVAEWSKQPSVVSRIAVGSRGKVRLPDTKRTKLLRNLRAAAYVLQNSQTWRDCQVTDQLAIREIEEIIKSLVVQLNRLDADAFADRAARLIDARQVVGK